MFIISMKTSKKKLAAYVFLGLICIAFLFVWVFQSKGADVAAKNISAVSVSDNQKRIDYLKSFGWKVSDEALEIVDVSIPQEFNEVYAKYNVLQKTQGFNLEDYMGKRCKRYTYEVTNYPNYQGGVYANILAYEGVVIGGDICSRELNGFMHGFSITTAKQEGTDE